MGNITGKGKHKVKVVNHPQTDMISKTAIIRRGQAIGSAFENNRTAT